MMGQEETKLTDSVIDTQQCKKVCERCGQELKDPVSIKRGYGMVCYYLQQQEDNDDQQGGQPPEDDEGNEPKPEDGMGDVAEGGQEPQQGTPDVIVEQRSSGEAKDGNTDGVIFRDGEVLV